MLLCSTCHEGDAGSHKCGMSSRGYAIEAFERLVATNAWLQAWQETPEFIGASCHLGHLHDFLLGPADRLSGLTCVTSFVDSENGYDAHRRGHRCMHMLPGRQMQSEICRRMLDWLQASLVRFGSSASRCVNNVHFEMIRKLGGLKQDTHPAFRSLMRADQPQLCAGECWV